MHSSLEQHTPPIAEILCVKNMGGICVLWVLNEINENNYPENMKKKNRGSCLGVTCLIAQPIKPNLSGNGLDWLSYLAGNSQTHKPQMPPHF